MTVLIVEDSRPAYLAGRVQIGRYGFEHDHAEDGQQGLDKIQNNDYEFILMDLGLPFINGVDLTRKVRELGCKAPIFALTANMRDYNKSDLLDAGINIPFEKPLEAYDIAQICKHMRIAPKKNAGQLLDSVKPLDESNLLLSYYAEFLPAMALPRSEWTEGFKTELKTIHNSINNEDPKKLTAALFTFFECALHVNSVRLCLASYWPYKLIQDDSTIINDDNFRQHIDMLDNSAKCYFEALEDEVI